MARFTQKIVLFLLLQAAVFALLFASAQRSIDPYIATLTKKHRHVAATPRPRLLLVGGSGLAFGIHSDLLQQAFPGYAPTNFGLHAGMGLDFILADSLREVNQGDVVLLCLEFEIWPVFRNTKELWEALLCRPGTTIGVNKRWLADDGLGFIGHVTSKGIKNISGSPPRDQPGLYSAESFNEYGDMVGHRGLPLIRPMIDGDSRSTEPLGCENEEQLPTVRNFVSACERRGATVIILLPPVPAPLFELHQTDIAHYLARQREVFGDRVISRLEELPTDENLFFDGINHMTWEGGIQRTQALIRHLNASGKIKPSVFSPTLPHR